MSGPAALPLLSDAQIERYSRQIILPEVGATRQRALLAASIALAGDSEVARSAVRYLAAAGIGRIRLIEGAPSAFVPNEINSDMYLDISPLEGTTSLHPCAVVIDVTDSPELHDRLNRTCIRDRVPLILATATGSVATLADSPDAPCFACLTEWPAICPPGDDPLSHVTAALIGTVVATETIKHVLGIGTPLSGRLLCYNAQRAEFITSVIAKNPTCRVCGTLD